MRSKVFRVSFTWLGTDKGDYVDVIACTPYSACDMALKIKQKERCLYKDTDISKVELISEVQSV